MSGGPCVTQLEICKSMSLVTIETTVIGILGEQGLGGFLVNQYENQKKIHSHSWRDKLPSNV
jgi:hypothetical protein